jgi:hypothetical protein
MADSHHSPLKDLSGGCLALLLGVGAVLRSVDYGLGSLTSMGPGFFPCMVGVLLIGCGVVLIARWPHGRLMGQRKASSNPPWRRLVFITLGLLAFFALGRYGGLVPAAFAVTFIAALGDRTNRVTDALLLGLGVVIVAVFVFHWALRVQLPLFCWG